LENVLHLFSNKDAMMRQLLNLQESQEVLKPYSGEITKCIQDSFNEFTEIQKFSNRERFVEFNIRTKANIIHDLIRSKITDTFSNTKNVETGDFNRIFGMNIDNQLFIRFKKMDRNFNVSATLTKQHKKYRGQQELEGFPARPTFLFAGYMPDKAWASLQGIYIACWHGDTLEWIDETGKYSYEQISLDLTSTGNDIKEVITRRITGKTGTEERKTGTN